MTLYYDENAASSPPEVTPELGDDGRIAFNTSAQIDPHAVDIRRTISTFESTPAELGSLSVDLNVQLEATEAEEQLTAAAADDGTDEEPVDQPSEQLVEAAAVAALETDTNPELPGTPSRSGLESPAAQKTPKTPQFVDALSSPASSDKLTANEELFEDAVSSPQLNIVNTHLKRSSSPISEGDDSSMLRLVAEYDQGSGRAGRQVPFVQDKENQPRRTRASSAKDAVSPGDPSGRMPSLRMQSLAQLGDKGSNFTFEIQKPPSHLSLIPETPAAKPNEASTNEIIDGVEIDWETTIIVDASSLENGDELPTIKRGNPHKRLVTYSKKRKHNLAAEDANEVPGSQNARASVESKEALWICHTDERLTSAEGNSQKKTSPSKKKHKGQPKKSSQVEQQIETNAEVHHSQSPSVDLAVSTPEVEIEDNTADMFTSSAKETTIDEGVDETENLQEGSYENLPATDDILGTYEDASMAAATEEGFTMAQIADESIDQGPAMAEEAFNIAQITDGPMDEITDTSVVIEVCPTSPNIERDKNTALNKGIFQDESSHAPESIESTNDSLPEIIPATSSDFVNSPSGEPEAHTSADAVFEAESETPTVQSMKEKLRSLIADMRGAALSREELNDFEDLFIDAKEQLYGAGRRGRERVVSGT
jgi:hypothetical protein